MVTATGPVDIVYLALFIAARVGHATAHATGRRRRRTRPGVRRSHVWALKGPLHLDRVEALDLRGGAQNTNCAWATRWWHSPFMTTPGWNQSSMRFALKLAVGLVVIAIVATVSGAWWIGVVVALLLVAAWSFFESRLSARHDPHTNDVG